MEDAKRFNQVISDKNFEIQRAVDTIEKATSSRAAKKNFRLNFCNNFSARMAPPFIGRRQESRALRS
jgi:hypothetical protein